MSDPAPQFAPTEIDSPIMEIALLIVGVHDDTVLALGTGFIIAPYIAMTATHVVEEFYKQFGSGTTLPKRTVECDFGVFALQYPRRPKPNIWNVTNAVFSSHSDLCFLQLVPENNTTRAYSFERTISLNFSPPPIGERVAAFGYPGTVGKVVDPKTLQLSINAATSSGVVTRLFNDYRDRSMLHFPCFEIDARLDGGMSGGPVFNSQGQCCGVVCASMPLPDGKHLSYASVLWPAVGNTLPFDTPNLIYKAPYSVIELCSIGVLHSPDWQKFSGRTADIKQDPLGIAKPRIKLK